MGNRLQQENLFCYLHFRRCPDVKRANQGMSKIGGPPFILTSFEVSAHPHNARG